MDILLIIAAPTLIGLWVLWKILRGRVPTEPVEVIRRNIYFCPHCQRTFVTPQAALQCWCRDRGSPFSPELTRQIGETQRMGDMIRAQAQVRYDAMQAASRDYVQEAERLHNLNAMSLEAHVMPPRRIEVEGVDELSREVLHHYSNRNGLRVMDGTVTISEGPQVIVSEGPISQAMLDALRDSLTVKNEPEPAPIVENRRLELS